MRISNPTAILWSQKALDSMHLALEKQHLLLIETELYSIYSQLLGACYPNQQVVVRNRQGGFQDSKLQHALFVEIYQPDDATSIKPHQSEEEGTCDPISILKGAKLEVVKIGLAHQIDYELQGWNAICPSGPFRKPFLDDPALLTVRETNCRISDSQKRTWGAIIYQDANARIGNVETASLEQVALLACTHHLFHVQSVSDCLIDVFHRLHEHLYRGMKLESSQNTQLAERLVSLIDPPHSSASHPAYVSKPADLLSSRLNKRINKWKSLPDRSRLLKKFNASMFDRHRERTRSPEPIPIRNSVHCVTAIFRLALEPVAQEILAELLPPFSRARCHGDLHGRNVQVGLFGSNVNYPIVFDYEHAGPEKLVAWDFIKLEYEIKVRILAQVLDSENDQSFFEQVVLFEQSLWEACQSIRGHNPTDEAPKRHAPLDRLGSILLTLRRSAAEVLLTAPDRSDWQEEFRFVSTLYSVCNVDYGYSDRERMAACISGSVAAGNSEWMARLYAWDFARWKAAIDPGLSDLCQLDSMALVTWEAPVAAAKTLIDQNRELTAESTLSLQSAERLLRRVIQAYPGVSAPWEELLLALLEQGAHQEFERAFDQAEGEIVKTYEFFSRIGRFEKDRGYDLLAQGHPAVAISLLKKGCEHYRRGYELNRHHYPGVNLAAVSLYLAAAYHHDHQAEKSIAALNESRSIAREVLKELESRPTESDSEAYWQLATRAEAMMLSGQIEASEGLYHQLESHPGKPDRGHRVYEKQKKRNEDALLWLDDVNLTGYGRKLR